MNNMQDYIVLKVKDLDGELSIEQISNLTEITEIANQARLKKDLAPLKGIFLEDGWEEHKLISNLFSATQETEKEVSLQEVLTDWLYNHKGLVGPFERKDKKEILKSILSLLGIN